MTANLTTTTSTTPTDSAEEVVSFDKMREAAVCSKPPIQFRRHWHLSAEFVYCRRNNSIWEINGKQYCLSQGDVLLIWPTELHAILKEPKEGSILIQFPPSFLENCPDLSQNLPYLRRHHHIGIDRHPDESRHLFELFNKIKEVMESNHILKGVEVNIYIYQSLLIIGNLLLFSDRNASDAPVSYKRAINQSIEDICSYIMQNYSKDISLKEMADRTGYSIYYFSRMFHEYTSMTFKEYIFSKRIQHSIYLLTSSDVPITEVSYRVGFQSISCFNKVFKAQMHCTPNEYRKMYDDKAQRRLLSLSRNLTVIPPSK